MCVCVCVQARLMWLIESWGVEKFREAVIEEMRTNKVCVCVCVCVCACVCE
jgi:sulfite reductase beta subunit-like hemoprotein